MRGIRKSLLTLLMVGLIFHSTPLYAKEPCVPKVTVIEVEEKTAPEPKVVNKPIEQVSSIVIDEPKEEIVEEELLSREEIELIALVTMAEAEGESEYGKRLVIDTILNRVDHERFPDNVTDVIYQRSQFTSVWNGRIDRCYVQEEIVQLVREELSSRTNYDVIFFTAGNYGKYGVQMFNVGNHYFSRYD